MSSPISLSAACFDKLKRDGQFIVHIKSHGGTLDVTSYVAAQNGAGWIKAGTRYLPTGAGPAALLLANVGFFIPEDSFEPLVT